MNKRFHNSAIVYSRLNNIRKIMDDKKKRSYIDNRGFWLDFKIIIKTFGSVLKGEGAV